MKRIVLFLGTNIAVLLVLSFFISVLGVGRWLTAQGIDYAQLLVFSAIIGFAGAFISLLMSKPIAKWTTGAHVIDGSEGPAEVAVYEGAPQPMVAALARLGGLAPGAPPESMRASGISDRAGVTALFSTHPPIEERIAGLQGR